jgi:hypothetical protein
MKRAIEKRMLMTCEGFQFKLEIRDGSEEV